MQELFTPDDLPGEPINLAETSLKNLSEVYKFRDSNKGKFHAEVTRKEFNTIYQQYIAAHALFVNRAVFNCYTLNFDKEKCFVTIYTLEPENPYYQVRRSSNREHHYLD